ncbi:hypothetical protein Tco_1134849 [Tanacetum coccineum]
MTTSSQTRLSFRIRRQSGIAFRDSFIVSKKRSSDSSKKLKGIQTLTPAKQEVADIMKALKESKKISKRQPRTGGSNEGTGNILRVPDESTVVSRASNKGTGSKPGVLDEEKLILDGSRLKDEPGKTTMETEVESMVTVPIQQVSSSVPLLILQSSISHLLNQYLLPVKNHSLQLSPPTSALQQSSFQFLKMCPSHGFLVQISSDMRLHLNDSWIPSVQDSWQNSVSQHPISGPVLDEMTSDQIRSDLTPNRQETSVDNIYSDLSHEYQWTKDHPLEQVIDNPTNPVQTRQQLATDPEISMFALIGGRRTKNSKRGNGYFCMDQSTADELALVR